MLVKCPPPASHSVLKHKLSELEMLQNKSDVRCWDRGPTLTPEEEVGITFNVSDRIMYVKMGNVSPFPSTVWRRGYV